MLSRSHVPINAYNRPNNTTKTNKNFISTEEELENLEFKLKHIETQLETIEIQKESFVQEIEYEEQKTEQLKVTIEELNENFQNYKKFILPKLTNQWELNLKIDNLNCNLNESIEDNKELGDLKNYLETNLELVSGKWFENANAQVEEERKKNFELEKSVDRLNLLTNDTLALVELERDQQIELKAMIEKLESNTFESPESFSEPKTPPQLRNDNDVEENPIKYALKPDLNSPKYSQYQEFINAPATKGIYQTSNFMKSTLAEDIEPSSKFKAESSIWSNTKQMMNSLIENKIQLDCSGDKSVKDSTNSQCSLCSLTMSIPSEAAMILPNQSPQSICASCKCKLSALISLISHLRNLRASDRIQKKGGYIELLRLKHKLFLARTGSQLNNELD